MPRDSELRRAPARRNPIAAGLRNFRHKVEKGRKQYVRHEKHKKSSVDETDMRH